MSKHSDEDQFQATILTLFPEMFPGTLGHSLAGRALDKGVWSLSQSKSESLQQISIRQLMMPLLGVVMGLSEARCCLSGPQ